MDNSHPCLRLEKFAPNVGGRSWPWHHSCCKQMPLPTVQLCIFYLTPLQLHLSIRPVKSCQLPKSFLFYCLYLDIKRRLSVSCNVFADLWQDGLLTASMLLSHCYFATSCVNCYLFGCWFNVKKIYEFFWEFTNMLCFREIVLSVK